MISRLKLIEARMLAIDPDIFPGAVTEDTVQEAERQLSVSFPQSYRYFLKEVGAADFPFEIFGLAPEDLSAFSGSYWDVVDVTQSERHEVEPPMQHHLVPFTPNGMGDHWCLDTSQMHLGECPVVFWNHENGVDQKPNQTHEAFLDWLEEAVNLQEEEMSE